MLIQDLGRFGLIQFNDIEAGILNLLDLIKNTDIRVKLARIGFLDYGITHRGCHDATTVRLHDCTKHGTQEGEIRVRVYAEPSSK